MIKNIFRLRSQRGHNIYFKPEEKEPQENYWTLDLDLDPVWIISQNLIAV